MPASEPPPEPDASLRFTWTRTPHERRAVVALDGDPKQEIPLSSRLLSSPTPHRDGDRENGTSDYAVTCAQKSALVGADQRRRESLPKGRIGSASPRSAALGFWIRPERACAGERPDSFGSDAAGCSAGAPKSYLVARSPRGARWRTPWYFVQGRPDYRTSFEIFLNSAVPARWSQSKTIVSIVDSVAPAERQRSRPATR